MYLAFASMTVLTGTICDDIRLCLFSNDRELLKYQVFDESYHTKLSDAVQEFLSTQLIRALEKYLIVMNIIIAFQVPVIHVMFIVS